MHSLYFMFYMSSHLSCTRATSDLRPAGTTEKTTKLQQLQSNISLPITAIWKQKYQHYCETRSLLVRTASGLDFIICALRPNDDPFITPSMRLFATSRSMVALFVVCFRFLKKSKIWNGTEISVILPQRISDSSFCFRNRGKSRSLMMLHPTGL